MPTVSDLSPDRYFEIADDFIEVAADWFEENDTPPEHVREFLEEALDEIIRELRQRRGDFDHDN
jgi:hypothetical protein